jgi:hypothetical protein
MVINFSQNIRSSKVFRTTSILHVSCYVFILNLKNVYIEPQERINRKMLPLYKNVQFKWQPSICTVVFFISWDMWRFILTSCFKANKSTGPREGNISCAHRDLVHMCTYKILVLHFSSNVSRRKFFFYKIIWCTGGELWEGLFQKLPQDIGWGMEGQDSICVHVHQISMCPGYVPPGKPPMASNKLVLPFQ